MIENILSRNNKTIIITQSIDDLKLIYASNNWLRNHNYPSRRRKSQFTNKKNKKQTFKIRILDEFSNL